MAEEISVSTIQNLVCAPNNCIAPSICLVQNHCNFFPLKPGENLQQELTNCASRICQIPPLFQDKICSTKPSLDCSLYRNASQSRHRKDNEIAFLDSTEKLGVFYDNKQSNDCILYQNKQRENIKISSKQLSVLYNNEQLSDCLPHESERKEDAETTILSNEKSPFLERSTKLASDCSSHRDENLSGNVEDSSDYSLYQNEIQSGDREYIATVLENGPVLCNEQTLYENQPGNKEDIEALSTLESHVDFPDLTVPQCLPYFQTGFICDKKEICFLPSVMANSTSDIDSKQELQLLQFRTSRGFISQISLQNPYEFLFHESIITFFNSLHNCSNKVIMKGTSTAISPHNAKPSAGIDQLFNFATLLGTTQATNVVKSSGLTTHSAETCLNLLTKINNFLTKQQDENVRICFLRCLFNYMYNEKMLNPFKNIKLCLDAMEQEESSRSKISSVPVIFNSATTSSSKLIVPFKEINSISILKPFKADIINSSEVPTVYPETGTVPMNMEEPVSQYVQRETDKHEILHLQVQQPFEKYPREKKRSYLKLKDYDEQQDIEDPNWAKFKVLNEEELQDSILKIWNVKESDRFNPRKNLSVSNYRQRRGLKSRKRKCGSEQHLHVKRSRNYSATFMEDIEYEKVNENFKNSCDKIRKECCNKTHQLIAKHDQFLKQFKTSIRLMSLSENPSVTQALENMLDKGTEKLSGLLFARRKDLKMIEKRALRNIKGKHSSDLDKISKCKNEIEEVGSFYQSLGDMTVLNGDEAQNIWETAQSLKMYKYIYKT